MPVTRFPCKDPYVMVYPLMALFCNEEDVILNIKWSSKRSSCRKARCPMTELVAEWVRKTEGDAGTARRETAVLT